MASISVIVPVYNKWAYLQRSIDSILAQDVRGMEVVLVDDASTDGSGELCETLYGGRDGVRILHLPENGGAGAARNAGMRVAEGRYIAFVDADDIVHPGYLRRLYETGILYHADVVAENGTAVDRPMPFPASFAERCHLIWNGEYLTSAVYKIYRASFLRAHGITFRPIALLEDVLFGVETFLRGRGVRLPGIRYEVVETPTSVTRGDRLAKCPAYMDSILKAFRALDGCLATLPEAQAQPAAREMLFAFLMVLSIQNHFGIAAKDHSLEEINEAIAPVLQREFGANAHYVQMLLDWCIGGR